MMFKNFFRRRKKEKKKEEELKKKEKVDDPKGSVGELLNIGKDVTVIKTSFPDVKLGVKFSKGEVATISDAARKLGLCEGTFSLAFLFFLIDLALKRFRIRFVYE